MVSQWEELKKKIHRKRGFNCQEYKESSLKRRIGSRMRARGVKSYREYSQLLDKEKGEWDELMNTLTITWTDFFRDPKVFEAFKEEILPEVIWMKELERRKVIRLWSAGCASGEETYSIAMIVKEVLGERLSHLMVYIHGTDIDEEALEKAKKGVYHKKELEDVKKEYLQKYFILKDGKFQVKKELKELVKFEKHDVISGELLQHFDVIFCRNLLVYLSRESQDEIFQRFYRVLNPQGYLIIGKSETLTLEARKKFRLISLEHRIYEKPFSARYKT